MAQRSWISKTLQERVEMTIGLFPTLAQDNVQHILREWSKGEYDDSWHGEERAIADLLSLLRTASMTPEQRKSERLRITLAIEEKLK